LAVSVTASADAFHQSTLAAKWTLVAFAATVTVAGNFTAALLLTRLTNTPPAGAADFSVAVQVSVAVPVAAALSHVTAFNAAVPAAA
jgi:hypothetical protein